MQSPKIGYIELHIAESQDLVLDFGPWNYAIP